MWYMDYDTNDYALWLDPHYFLLLPPSLHSFSQSFLGILASVQCSVVLVNYNFN